MSLVAACRQSRARSAVVSVARARLQRPARTPQHVTGLGRPARMWNAHVARAALSSLLPFALFSCVLLAWWLRGLAFRYRKPLVFCVIELVLALLASMAVAVHLYVRRPSTEGWRCWRRWRVAVHLYFTFWGWGFTQTCTTDDNTQRQTHRRQTRDCKCRRPHDDRRLSPSKVLKSFDAL